MTNCELLILGGGASGLAAAVEAARRGVRVTILEKLDRVGKKILATGNGRCNLLNLHASPAQYNDPAFAGRILEAYDVQDDLRFFRELGLLTTADSEGRVYPRSMAASSVLDVLRLECVRLRVQIHTGTPATEIRRDGGSFVVNGEFRARAVIVACGGKAAPAQGSDGSGYPLLQSMGHTVTALRPALVQIRTEPSDVRALKGLRSAAALTLRTADGKCVYSKGEILFTEYGVSGIAAMELSRRAFAGSTLVIDLLPELDDAQTLGYLHTQRLADPARPAESFLTGLCQNRIGQTILRRAGIPDLSLPCGQLTDAMIASVCGMLKALPLRVTGTKGFPDAQVTAGGAVNSEFDNTLASRKVRGLFACGEILDVDGLCGGYNLTFAWSSGRLAAKSATDYLHKQG